MSSKDSAITAEGISKIYRLGLKESMRDNFASTLWDMIISPLRNYRKYRSLYTFDDATLEDNQGAIETQEDILWALRDVNFEIKKGEVVGIIGRNGAGKSTLLKVLSRITSPTQGQVEIKGRVASLLEVGTGFHQELSGRENVYLNGTVLGMRKKEVDSKFDEIVAFSGIEKFIDTPIKRYSSGMKIRLAFAVAAHLEPEILIVDEVLAVGDAAFQKKCLEKMEDIGHGGRTVIFVSHNMQAVTRLCPRAIIMENGRIIKDGESGKVVSSYLTSDLGTTAARDWSDEENAPGSDIARLRATRVKTEEGKVSEFFDISSPIGIEMEFEVLKSGEILMPHHHVYNAEGICIFTTLDNDPNWSRRPRPKGRYKSTVWIPGNLLSEGSVFVEPCLMTLDPNVVQFHMPSAIAFNVVENEETAMTSSRAGYSGSLAGIVRPYLKWETDFSEVS